MYIMRRKKYLRLTNERNEVNIFKKEVKTEMLTLYIVIGYHRKEDGVSEWLCYC